MSEWAERAPCRVLGYGIECSRATVRARAIDDSSLNGLAFTLETPRDRRRIHTKLLGRPNVYAVLAAVAAAEVLGLDIAVAHDAIARFEPVAHRLQLCCSARFGWLLDDSYNASPQATREALQTLARLRAADHQKIFAFGGMLELGQHSAVAHREIAAEIARLKASDRFFGLGELAAETGRMLITGHGWDPERVTMTSRRDELIEMINRQLRGKKNLILIKGSRAAELDRVVEALL